MDLNGRVGMVDGVDGVGGMEWPLKIISMGVKPFDVNRRSMAC